MKRFFLILTCIFIVNLAFSQPLSQKITTFERELSLIRDSLQNIGLAVVYVENNEIVYQNAFGLQSKEQNLPLTNDCLFRIASISKSFTTTGLLQQVEQGKLSLQDDVSQLIGFQVRNPKFPDTVITLEMLLSHTSSLNDSQDYVTLDNLQPQLYADWQKCYNDYAPGTGYEYCNLNLNLAGTILERVSGERFDEYIRHHILEPLGLYGGYCVDSLDNTRFASLYQNNQLRAEAYTPRRERLQNYQIGGYDTPMFSPTGGMKISAPDLARYMIMHMNYGQGILNHQPVRIISEAHARDMQIPRSNIENYGLTLWQTNTYSPNVTLVGHTGGAYGLRSAMFFNPEEKYGFVVISNGALENGGDNILTQTLRLMYRIFQQ